MSKVQAFLCNGGSDHRGRTAEQILSFDDDLWDECHDFIQWLFPLPVESKHAAYSPVLTSQDLNDLWNSSIVWKQLYESTKRFLNFLGLEIHMPYGTTFEEGPFRVSMSHIRSHSKFSDQTKYWLRANDHNHLRINRMLQCLVLFGLENLAKEIFRCLVMIKCEFTDCITDETMVYWRNALTGYSY